MAKLILDSLALSDILVRADVVEACLGVSGKAGARASGKRNPMRHPLPGERLPEPGGVFGQAVGHPTAGQTPQVGWR